VRSGDFSSTVCVVRAALLRYDVDLHSQWSHAVHRSVKSVRNMHAHVTHLELYGNNEARHLVSSVVFAT